MALTTVRLHSYTADTPEQFNAHSGSVSCDFRGANFIGDAEGDHHSTRFEKDVEDSDPLVAEVLAVGPSVNALLNKLAGAEPSGIPGGRVGLRVGVWDKTAPH